MLNIRVSRYSNEGFGNFMMFEFCKQLKICKVFYFQDFAMHFQNLGLDAL